ncbi:c-type cytochrome [Spiribacter halobius]|uniref:Cytochrome c domain-containing protein n=1 Tax=Sediminicurvatus halobius TaxID=2182432 RepID=A0A2U2MVT6_9GAMM|nr:cytochrome c [Spiribacter halobius]PWG60942.1 hypothetical protein DEM34_19010 [Spiribacter halobius]UEX76611.1 cytochrome c [Spiribacter halobius]
MNQEKDRARRREQPEPEEGTRPVPKVVSALLAGLVLWGSGYILWHAGWPLTGGDSRTPVVLQADEGVNGANLYANVCASCHQGNGRGVPGAFPPLADSAWVTGDPRIPVAIVHDGLQGPIEVAGERYQGAMPAFGGQLSAAEIAAVVSHVRNAWSNGAAEVSTDVVAGYRERFAERGPWTVDALRTELGGP